MKLTKDIEIIDLALKIGDNLVICDTHIGYEEYLNKIGIMVPRFQFKEIITRLEKIIDYIKNKNINKNNGKKVMIKNINKLTDKKINVKNKNIVYKKNINLKTDKITNKRLFNKIVINGDIKHEFGTISEQEWRHTLRLFDFLKKYCDEIILVRGNHDTILGPIANKRGVKVVDYYVINGTLIIHGNKLINEVINELNKKIIKNKNNRSPIKINIKNKIGHKINLNKLKNIVIGHEHPAISLKEGPHTETYKCYLVGRYKSKNLIVQPSFNLVTEGANVLKEKLFSPFIEDISNFKVYAVEDRVYDFGTVQDLRSKI